MSALKEKRLAATLRRRETVAGSLEIQACAMAEELKRRRLVEKYGEHPMLRSAKEDAIDRRETWKLEPLRIAPSVASEREALEASDYDPFDPGSSLSRKARDRRRYKGFNPFSAHLWSDTRMPAGAARDRTAIAEWALTRYGGPAQSNADQAREAREALIARIGEEHMHISDAAMRSALTLQVLGLEDKETEEKTKKISSI
jgi:hypothetical protein